VNCPRSSVRDNPVGERHPPGGLFAAGAALGDLAQAGRADQPAVRPSVGLDLPDAGVGVWLLPALLDRVDRCLRRPPAVAVKVVVTSRLGEQQQRLAERVELKLLVHPIAHDVRAARVAGKVELALVGHLAARGRVGGLELGSVGQQAVGHEVHRVVHQRMRARLGAPGRSTSRRSALRSTTATSTVSWLSRSH
jgi:hypothetical protein